MSLYETSIRGCHVLNPDTESAEAYILRLSKGIPTERDYVIFFLEDQDQQVRLVVVRQCSDGQYLYGISLPIPFTWPEVACLTQESLYVLSLSFAGIESIKKNLEFLFTSEEPPASLEAGLSAGMTQHNIVLSSVFSVVAFTSYQLEE